jgi:hypothetical protein
VSLLDSDTDHYVITRVTRVYFEHTMGTKIIMLDMLLNAQDFSSVRLPAEGVTHWARYK